MNRIAAAVAFVAVLVAAAEAVLLGAIGDIPALAKQQLHVIDDRYLGNALTRVVYGRENSRTGTERVIAVRYDWLPPERLLPIAHALGPIVGSGMNTMATFQRGLALGFTVFEVDLSMTREGEIVCYHGADDAELAALTSQKVRTVEDAGGYRLCDLTDILAAAAATPHVRFVLDVKNHYGDIYAEIYRRIGASPVGRSLIPQLYSFAELDWFIDHPVFAAPIFTSYRSHLPTTRIFELARERGIHAVALTRERYDRWQGNLPHDPAVLMHPVDDLSLASRFLARGGRGIYTYYFAARVAPELFEDQPEAAAGPIVVR